MSRATSLGSSGNWLMSGVQPAQPSMQGRSLDEARHAVSKHWQPWMAIDIDVFKQQNGSWSVNLFGDPLCTVCPDPTH